MKKINLDALPWVEHRSPRGKFHAFFRDTAAAMSGAKGGPRLPGPPPFEVELVRLPPGARNFPFHSHAVEWEYYLVVSGTGVMRVNRRRVPLAPGDCVLCPPGDAHQIHNTGEANLLYYVIANHSLTDVYHYPDSKKWGSSAIPKCFRVTPLDYYDGEE